MKMLALAAALTLSAPAFAQTTPQSTTPPMPASDQSTQQGAIPYTETDGGYMPSQSPVTGDTSSGKPAVFQQAPSPEEAFPPPAPMESYPICKPHQYDNCRQRGG